MAITLADDAEVVQVLSLLQQVDTANKYFAEYTGWGAATVSYANQREDAVNELRTHGIYIEHKCQVRVGGQRTD